LFAVIICEFGVGGGAYTMYDSIGTELESSWKGLANTDKNIIQDKVIPKYGIRFSNF
jgi:hypothetical protein